MPPTLLPQCPGREPSPLRWQCPGSRQWKQPSDPVRTWPENPSRACRLGKGAVPEQTGIPLQLTDLLPAPTFLRVRYWGKTPLGVLTCTVILAVGLLQYVGFPLSMTEHCLFLYFGASQLAADPDPNVKSGSELLDRLLKVFLLCPSFIFRIYSSVQSRNSGIEKCFFLV